MSKDIYISAVERESKEQLLRLYVLALLELARQPVADAGVSEGPAEREAS